MQRHHFFVCQLQTPAALGTLSAVADTQPRRHSTQTLRLQGRRAAGGRYLNCLGVAPNLHPGNPLKLGYPSEHICAIPAVSRRTDTSLCRRSYQTRFLFIHIVHLDPGDASVFAKDWVSLPNRHDLGALLQLLLKYEESERPMDDQGVNRDEL